MEHLSVTKNSQMNNLAAYNNQEANYSLTAPNQETYSQNDLFYTFYDKFNEIFLFIQNLKENKNDLEDEVDDNLIKTLHSLCLEFLNYIKHINDFGHMNLSKNDQDLIIESYEKFVRQCKQYNDKPQVKQLENEISNLLDLLFNNTSEAVNTLFSADSFFMDHVENLKLKYGPQTCECRFMRPALSHQQFVQYDSHNPDRLPPLFRLTERNQKIQFEKERVKKLELEAKVEKYDEMFEKNKQKNNEMDETLSKLKKDINKLNEKIQKYDNYVKKKRKEIDINFSDTLDCKERIKLLEENIKTVERNIKITQLSPLKIVEKTEHYIIFEFTTIRSVMQFKVSNYQSKNAQVEINPCDEHILSYIKSNINKCKDISEITYLIKEAIYLKFLDI